MLNIIDGMCYVSWIKRDAIAGITHAPLRGSFTGIIIHQTNSLRAADTLGAYRSGGTNGNGAHFLLDKDGTNYQTVPLNRVAHHIKPSIHDAITNGNSIGIEIVGACLKPDGTLPTKEDKEGNNKCIYEDFTQAQDDALFRLLRALWYEFDLNPTVTYPHSFIRRGKNKTEASTLWNAKR